MPPYYVAPNLKHPTMPEKDLHKVPFQWMYSAAKLAFQAGTFTGIYNALMVRDLDHPLHIAGRIAYYSVPFTAMALAYTGVTFIAQDFRNKDTCLNHVLGACAASGILHAWQRNATQTHYSVVIFSLAAIAYHEAVKHDAPNFFQTIEDIQSTTYRLDFFDLSLIKDPPNKGWTR